MGKSLRKLNVAIIGCGRISVMHFSAIENLEESTLVACCDNKKSRADYFANKYNVKSYYDYKEMIDNEQLDAVHLCLPHYLHMPIAEYAINKGVAVISEKPMSIDYESAEKTVDLAEKKGVLLGIISQCRYNNSSQLVKKAISSGRLGKILSARSILTWSRSDDYYSESDWKGTWDKEGGGVVIDQAIHSIDLVNWIVDSNVKELSCSMANRGHKIVQVEDTAEGYITYENGTNYAFYCMNNYACDEPIEIKLFCEKGKAVFNYDDAYIYYNDGTVEEAHKDVLVKEVDGRKVYWGNQHVNQIKQFYKACLGKEELEISGREALKTHRLIMDIYQKGGMKNK